VPVCASRTVAASYDMQVERRMTVKCPIGSEVADAQRKTPVTYPKISQIS